MTASIAVFDFDNTLTDRDSLVPFLFYTNGMKRTLFHFIALTPVWIRFLMGYCSRQATKEAILTRCFKGWPYTRFQQFAKDYADHRLDAYLNSEAMQRLAWHQEQGHRCILVSASLECYLEPWGARHGFEKVIGSQLELTEEREITGCLAGVNCWGPEKMRRLLLYLGVKGEEKIYAYGDSRGDQELLAFADYPFYQRFS